MKQKYIKYRRPATPGAFGRSKGESGEWRAAHHDLADKLYYKLFGKRS